MGCVAGVGPYRWSKAGQLFLALALRFSSGLVPLLYLLLYLCLKTPHTQTRVFNMPWRTPQQQQQQTTKGSDSKTKTAVWESSNQGKLRLYNGSFCLCVQSPWMLGIAERTKKGELHRFLRNNADFTWKHVAAESGSLTHSSCRVCGAPCLPSCCSPVSSGSVPDRCTSSGSAHGTPPAATTERSALKSSVENEHGGFFCCCRFNYCTDSYYYSLPDTLCYGSPII